MYNLWGKVFTKKAFHIESVHESKKRFKCSQCSGKFTTKLRFEKHIAKIHEGKSKVYECIVCNKTFSRKEYLKLHISSVHEGKKSFDCIKCDTKFKQK